MESNARSCANFNDNNFQQANGSHPQLPTLITSQTDDANSTQVRAYRPNLASTQHHSLDNHLAPPEFVPLGRSDVSADQKRRHDTLRKIHAQSSADTSGLGDSLQRIHAFSSFESSGYGEGDVPPSDISPSHAIVADHAPTRTAVVMHAEIYDQPRQRADMTSYNEPQAMTAYNNQPQFTAGSLPNGPTPIAQPRRGAVAAHLPPQATHTQIQADNSSVIANNALPPHRPATAHQPEYDVYRDQRQYRSERGPYAAPKHALPSHDMFDPLLAPNKHAAAPAAPLHSFPQEDRRENAAGVGYIHASSYDARPNLSTCSSCEIGFFKLATGRPQL